MTEIIGLPYVLNNEGLTMYFKQQQVYATQITELHIENSDGIDVGNEFLIVLAKEVFSPVDTHQLILLISIQNGTIRIRAECILHVQVYGKKRSYYVFKYSMVSNCRSSMHTVTRERQKKRQKWRTVSGKDWQSPG